MNIWLITHDDPLERKQIIFHVIIVSAVLEVVTRQITVHHFVKTQFDFV